MEGSVLTKIQNELKVPKSQFNAFGKYYYRSCEDILAAVKPFLEKHNATLHIWDEMIQLGDRYYVKATALLTVSRKEEWQTIEAVGWARESEEKKGMDSSQITGAASSYARKYALNGLFLLDDIKDADAQTGNGEETDNKEKPKPAPKKTDKQTQHYPTSQQAVDLKELMMGETMGLNDKEFDSFKEWLKTRLPTMPVKSKEGNVKALSKESYEKVLIDAGHWLDEFIKAQQGA